MANILTSTDVLKVFNGFDTADEVRQWINRNIMNLHIYDEWPRGEPAMGILTGPMKECKFSSELKKDVRLFEDGWRTGSIPVL